MDEQQEILEICGGWAKQKLDLFSDWCFDELWAESFVCAHKIMHRYDATRSKLSTFLWNSLWDPVFHSYARERGIWVQYNTTGVGKRRSYSTPWRWLDETYDAPAPQHDDRDPVRFSTGHDDLDQLFGRGLTQAQVARALEMSPGTLSSKLFWIRHASHVD